jgi:NADP-dependent 3-hydroxy acid dehydrogenase YdfG
MPRLGGKIAWITGAGSGIGEAAALALADEGATTVLTGRTAEKLERVAARIRQQGGEAFVEPAELTDAKQVQKVGEFIRNTLGRLDILVNNAGVNIVNRHWDKLTPEGIDELVHGNLSQALYCVTVALPLMRAQKDGVLAMSHSINMQECINGIRSTVFLPGEVATPILDKRPNPVGPEERARMVQSEDCGDLIRYIACLPKHVVMSEVMLAPTHNRTYIANLQQKL